MSKNHDVFTQYLRHSQLAVARVEAWLRALGYPVRRPALRVAPTAADADTYSDAGDLFIPQRIEVKWLSAKFTGRADWPFGNDFIVCAKRSHDRADPKPALYLILDHLYRACGIVHAETERHWWVKKTLNSQLENEARHTDKYLCPLDLVMWVPLYTDRLNTALREAIDRPTPGITQREPPLFAALKNVPQVMWDIYYGRIQA